MNRWILFLMALTLGQIGYAATVDYATSQTPNSYRSPSQISVQFPDSRNVNFSQVQTLQDPEISLREKIQTTTPQTAQKPEISLQPEIPFAIMDSKTKIPGLNENWQVHDVPQAFGKSLIVFSGDKAIAVDYKAVAREGKERWDLSNAVPVIHNGTKIGLQDEAYKDMKWDMASTPVLSPDGQHLLVVQRMKKDPLAVSIIVMDRDPSSRYAFKNPRILIHDGQTIEALGLNPVRIGASPTFDQNGNLLFSQAMTNNKWNWKILSLSVNFDKLTVKPNYQTILEEREYDSSRQERTYISQVIGNIVPLEGGTYLVDAVQDSRAGTWENLVYDSKTKTFTTYLMPANEIGESDDNLTYHRNVNMSKIGSHLLMPVTKGEAPSGLFIELNPLESSLNTVQDRVYIITSDWINAHREKYLEALRKKDEK